jgi:hypothetical protein
MNAKAQEVTVLPNRQDNVINADAASLMAVITRAASDTSVDVDKLDRLLAMYERIKANEAKAAFAAAMAAAKREMPQVIRDKPNEQTKSKYASLEAIGAAIDPVITAHGFVPSFGTDISPVEGCYRITCKLLHAAGHAEDYFADIPADIAGMKGALNKTPTHAWGSTQTYGRRYLKLMIFDIALKNEDDDGNAAGASFSLIGQEQLDELRSFIVEYNVDIAKVLKKANADRLESISARAYPQLMIALRQWAARQPQPQPQPQPRAAR